MRRTFSRMNPNQSALQRPYRAYQALVAEQWSNVCPIPPDERIPVQVRHIQRVRPLLHYGRSAEQRARRETTATHFENPRLLAAAGELALELEERARWLAEHGTVITDGTTRNGSHCRLEATLPLADSPDCTDTQAEIGLYSERVVLQGKRRRVPHLGYLSVKLSGKTAERDERFWTYASVSSTLLSLAHPDTAGYTPTALYDTALIDGFELRDMLTFVENKAPGARLPQQPYPTHVVESPASISKLVNT